MLRRQARAPAVTVLMILGHAPLLVLADRRRLPIDLAAILCARDHVSTRAPVGANHGAFDGRFAGTAAPGIGRRPCVEHRPRRSRSQADQSNARASACRAAAMPRGGSRM